jgi:sugar lactone lactonase YvrE
VSLFVVAAGMVAGAGAAPGSVVQPERPGALAIGPEGALYIADTTRQQILMRLPDGGFRVLAGTGRAGFSGDGGPATGAELRDPQGMVVSANGTLYFADQGNNRVREVTPDGRIATVAGDGRYGWVKSGTRALNAQIGSPSDVTFGPDGLLYIAGGNEILRLNRAGTVTRIAGNQRYEGVYGIGSPAANASPDGPDGLAFSGGDLFIAGFDTKALLMIDVSGTMRAPIGMTGFYPRGTGGIVTTRTGQVVAMDTQAIVALTPNSIRTIYNFGGRRRVAGIRNFLPNGLAVDASGTIYTDTDEGNGWANGTAIVAVKPDHTVSVLWTP